LLLLLSQLIYASSLTVRNLHQIKNPSESPLQTKKGHFVIDTTARGVLPVILWHVDPEAMVFASQQEVLLDQGLPDLPSSGNVYYISHLGYGNSQAGRENLLQAFSNRGYDVHVLKTDLWDGETYQLKCSRQVCGSVSRSNPNSTCSPMRKKSICYKKIH
jgi:hypothetical protein